MVTRWQGTQHERDMLRPASACPEKGKVVIQSITERLDEIQLLNIFHQLPVGCILLGRTSGVEYLNQAVEKLFGYTREETLGMDPVDLFIPDREREAFVRLVTEATTVPVPEIIESRTKDGELLTCKWQCKLLEDEPARHPRRLLTVESVSTEKSVEERLNRQIQYLRTLRTIDLTISGSTDIRTILQVALREAMEQLGMSAIVVLTFDPVLNLLKFTAGRGLQTNALESTGLRLGNGYAGKAALERKTIKVADLTPNKADFLHLPDIEKEGFKSYYCVPLISKGVIQGILESFHRSRFVPNREWLDFFETLGGQIAIAIQGVKLFSELQRSNLELNLAYDATLEGWSKALDMRDRDAEGHTRRVTDLTEQLAAAMGVDMASRVNIRRGALLHDIGKLGIPDRILLKQGELTGEDWEAIRKHPILAYELLKPIPFLAEALDIPYCHHERWDGSGYPRGLKGDQIPLAARIFAVADVFDALTSERLYREAWPVEKALEYLKAESGKRFDPAVLDVFLQIMRERRGSNTLPPRGLVIK